MEIRLLDPDSDDCSLFSCGDAYIDTQFRTYAALNQRKQWSVTYVAVDDGCIVGFATLACGRVDDLPPELMAGKPRNPPALLLALLGTSVERQHQGIGTKLVKRVLPEALAQAKVGGCFGVLVDAYKDKTRIYEKFGFKAYGKSDSGKVRMFLPMTAIVEGIPFDYSQQ